MAVVDKGDRGNVQISRRTINILADIIVGDGEKYRYRSRKELVELFVPYGLNSDQEKGDPESRLAYTKKCISQLNGTPDLGVLIKYILHPREYLQTNFRSDTVANNLNEWLQLDGYDLIKSNDHYEIIPKDGLQVILRPFLEGSIKDNHSVILEQIHKCDQKIVNGDYDGAITNARTLLTAILKEIEGEDCDYSGDIVKLYRKVQARLKLDPSCNDLPQSIQKICTGLITIINGLAETRNAMSDAHPREYSPLRHHANLTVNASKTIARFLLEAKAYQDKVTTHAIA